MKGLRYDLKVYKVLLKKLHIGGKYIMVKYREDWEKPHITHKKQILVKNLYTGICGTDYSQIHVHLAYSASIMAVKENPSPMGHEVLAQVVEIGEEVTSFKKGDRVVYSPLANCESYGLKPCGSCQKGYFETCQCIAGIANQTEFKKSQDFGGYRMGGFDEFMLGYENQFFKVPSSIPDNIAVLAEPYATALHAVLQKKPQETDTVLVIGGGIIGLLVVAAIKALKINCTIIITTKYTFQGQKAKELGANSIIIEKNKRLLIKSIANLTEGKLVKPIIGNEFIFGGKGPDIIYDCVGTDRTLDDALRLVRNNGSIIIVGMSFSTTKKVDWSLLNYKEIHVIGDLCYGLESSFGNKNTFSIALELMEKQISHLKSLVTHMFAIDDYKRGFDIFGQKEKYKSIKVVFDMNGPLNSS